MQNRITIRKGNRDDARAVHELHTRSVLALFPGYYSDAQIHGFIDRRTPEGYFPAIDEGRLFVAVDGSVIVGFGEAVPGHVLAMYVTPDRAREGIGSVLLEYALTISRKGSDKVVLEASLNAVGFYRKRGFIEIEKKILRRGNVELPCILMEYTGIR